MTTITPTVPRRVRGTLARTLLAGVAAAALASCAFGTLAHAKEENAKIDEVIFDVTPTPFAAIVKVISSDGEKWTAIQPTDIAFDARIKIDTKGTGYIEQYAVFLGACSNPSCGSHPKVLGETVLRRDMDRSGTIRFSSKMLLGVDSAALAAPTSARSSTAAIRSPSPRHTDSACRSMHRCQRIPARRRRWTTSTRRKLVPPSRAAM